MSLIIDQRHHLTPVVLTNQLKAVSQTSKLMKVFKLCQFITTQLSASVQVLLYQPPHLKRMSKALKSAM